MNGVIRPRRSRARLWLGLAGLAALGVGSYAVWAQEGEKSQASAPAPQASQAQAPVPVSVAKVTARDMPIYLTGIGTAQAFQSVTLKVRIDGQITQIAVDEGAFVKKGDVIARIDPRPVKAQLDQAVAQKAKDEALLANARADLERFQQLIKNEFTSRQSLDTQRALVSQYEATVSSDQAMIEYQQTQLGYATVTSPISGVAGIRLVDEGNIVRAADASGIMVINQVEPISGLFTLPQDVLDRVRTAMKAGPVKVFASARTDIEPRAEGTLAVVNNQIDQGTGNVQLKATFENHDHVLWPGQFLNFKVLIETRANAMTMAATAIQRGANGMFVYAVKDDGTVEARPVKLLQSIDGVAIVEKGVEPGMSVVTDGQYKLRPGTKIVAQPEKTALNEGKNGSPRP